MDDRTSTEIRVLARVALTRQRRAELVGMLRMAKYCPTHSGAWPELAEFIREHDELHVGNPGLELARAVPESAGWEWEDPYADLRAAAKRAGTWAIDYSRNTVPRPEVQYDVATAPVQFRGKRFCFTGIFAHHPRGSCEELTRRFGGRIQRRVALNTDYLVVGTVADPNWLGGSQGTKIQTGTKNRSTGRSKIMIIDERTFLRGAAGEIRRRQHRTAQS